MYLEIKSYISKVEHKIRFIKYIVSFNSYHYENFVSFSNFSDENNSISISNWKNAIPKISLLPLRIDSNKRVSCSHPLFLESIWNCKTRFLAIFHFLRESCYLSSKSIYPFKISSMIYFYLLY